MERNTLETTVGLVRILPLRDDPHGELGDLKGYGLASPTHDTELNCFTNTTHGLARTALLLLPRNSRYPDSLPEICYGTDFVTTASVFSSFILGVKLQHSAVAGSQLLLTLPSLAANSSLCRRWQATLFSTLQKLEFQYVLAEI